MSASEFSRIVFATKKQNIHKRVKSTSSENDPMNEASGGGTGRDQINGPDILSAYESFSGLLPVGLDWIT